MAERVQLAGDRNRISRKEIIGTTDRGVESRAGTHVIEDNPIADGTADGIGVT